MKSKEKRDYLNGRESSVLALLAETQHLSTSERLEILTKSKLTGDALKIGKILAGDYKNASKKNIIAAQGFIDWAKKIKENKQIDIKKANKTTYCPICDTFTDTSGEVLNTYSTYGNSYISNEKYIEKAHATFPECIKNLRIDFENKLNYKIDDLYNKINQRGIYDPDW